MIPIFHMKKLNEAKANHLPKVAQLGSGQGRNANPGPASVKPLSLEAPAQPHTISPDPLSILGTVPSLRDSCWTSLRKSTFSFLYYEKQ